MNVECFWSYCSSKVKVMFLELKKNVEIKCLRGSSFEKVVEWEERELEI